MSSTADEARVLVPSVQRMLSKVRQTIQRDINTWLATDARASKLDEPGRKRVRTTGSAFLAALESLLEDNLVDPMGVAAAFEFKDGGKQGLEQGLEQGQEGKQGESEEVIADYDEAAVGMEEAALVEQVRQLQSEVARLVAEVKPKRRSVPVGLAQEAKETQAAVMDAINKLIAEPAGVQLGGAAAGAATAAGGLHLVDKFDRFLTSLRSLTAEVTGTNERATDMVHIVDEKLAAAKAVQAGDPSAVAAARTAAAGRDAVPASPKTAARKRIARSVTARRSSRRSKPY